MVDPYCVQCCDFLCFHPAKPIFRLTISFLDDTGIYQHPNVLLSSTSGNPLARRTQTSHTTTKYLKSEIRFSQSMIVGFAHSQQMQMLCELCIAYFQWRLGVRAGGRPGNTLLGVAQLRKQNIYYNYL